MTDDNKPKEWREWNIQVKHGKVMSASAVYMDAENVHVIERAALTEAEAEAKQSRIDMEIADARAQLLADDLNEAEREIAKYKTQPKNAYIYKQNGLLEQNERLTKENAELKRELDTRDRDSQRDGQVRAEYWREVDGERAKLTKQNEEQAKEIVGLKELNALQKLYLEGAEKFAESANEIIAGLESALSFYGETDNWPYASKGKCPGEKANDALAKLSEFRNKK